MFGNPEVSSPQIVVIVGSLGLLSNIVGLFLFHEHGHGHSHGHSHSHASKAEEGQSNAVTTFSSAKKLKNGHATGANGSTNGNTNERTPLLANGSSANDFPTLPGQQAASQGVAIGGAETPFSDRDEDDDEAEALDELLVHPARTREAIVRQAYDAGFGTPRTEGGFGGHRRTPSFQSGIGKHGRSRTGSASFKNRERSASRGSGHDGHDHDHTHEDGHDHDEEEHHDHEVHDHDHDHDDEDDEHALGGHSHANMNMQGVFLHVLGDAVGFLYYH